MKYIFKRYFIFISILCISFLATWKDFELRIYLGEIFRSPIVLLIPFFVILEIFFHKEYQKFRGYGFTRINIFFLIFHVLFSIMTIIYWIKWIEIDNRLTFELNENIFLKSIKSLCYYTLSWLVFRCYYFLLYKARVNQVNISNIFLVLNIFYLFVIIVEYFTIPYAWPAFHTQELYNRIRLFTPESSFTGWILLLLTCGSLIGIKGIYRKMTVFSIVSFFIIFVLTTGSKQFVGSIAIALILYYLFFTHLKEKFRYFPFIILFCFLYFLFVLPNLELRLMDDRSTTLATRGIGLFSAFLFQLDHPLGAGGMAYYYLIDYLKELTTLFRDLNTSEISAYGIFDLRALSTKSMPGQILIFIGIPGVCLLFYLYKTLICCAKKNLLLTIGVLYFIIASVFDPVLEGHPDTILFIGLITFYYDFKESNKKY
jgi:hypothetical protein